MENLKQFCNSANHWRQRIPNKFSQAPRAFLAAAMLLIGYFPLNIENIKANIGYTYLHNTPIHLCFRWRKIWHNIFSLTPPPPPPGASIVEDIRDPI